MCFSLGFFEQLCIYLVLIGAVWAIIQLLLPLTATALPAVVIGIIRIVFWAIIAILIIYVIFGLLGCVASGGLSIGRFR